jgi:hypothetical protein
MCSWADIQDGLAFNRHLDNVSSQVSPIYLQMRKKAIM